MKTNVIKPTSTTSFTGNAVIDKFLTGKGLDAETYELLLNPIPEHSPWLFHGMREIVDSLYADALIGARICIIGDYDADGITSTSILYLMLDAYGANVDFIIPHRINDGYGLSKKLVDKAINEKGAEVILTCDNGIVAFEAVEYAKEKGLKVYVTDHHEPQETLPDAHVIIHPSLGYPFASISGCEVAYKIAQAMFEAYPLEKPNKRDELIKYFTQLAGISIVSDVMPVGAYTHEEMKVNENRGLLKKAIGIMKKEIDPRINHLLEAQALHHKNMDETMIGFNISPVLNACGRMADAEVAVHLLIAKDERDIELYGSLAESYNQIRKEETTTTYKKAVELVDKTKPILVIRTEAHEGLIGIIAGKISEQFQKPSIIFAAAEIEDEDGNILKAWKGSARSNSVNIFETINKIDKQYVYKFGGHAGAAGMTILDDCFEEFEKQLIEIVEKDTTESTETDLDVVSCDLTQINGTGKALNLLKPFGNGFQKPVVETVAKVNQVDYFYSSGHVKISYWSSATGSVEFWLYGEMENFQNASLIPDFTKTMDNMAKKQKELGLSAEEAWASHWERWQAKTIVDNDGNIVKRVVPIELDMLLELDYGVNFNGVDSVLTRTLQYSSK